MDEVWVRNLENGMNEDDEDSGFRLTVLIASLLLTV